MRKHGSHNSAVLTEKPVETTVVIDYPQEKEVIISAEYTFRLGSSPEIERVEVSLNGGDWQPCRPSVGFWWYDWSNYSKPAQRLQARATTKTGETIFSEPRSFTVKLPKSAVAAKPAAKVSKTRKKLSRLAVIEA